MFRALLLPGLAVTLSIAVAVADVPRDAQPATQWIGRSVVPKVFQLETESWRDREDDEQNDEKSATGMQIRVSEEKGDDMRVHCRGQVRWVKKVDFLLIEEARPYFENLILKDPRVSGNHMMLAWIHFIQAKPKEASESITEAIRLDPKQAQSHIIRSAICQQLKDLPGAYAAASAAVKLEPGWVTARLHRACVAAETGKTSQALIDMEFVCLEEPDRLKTLLVKAKVHEALGRLKETHETLNRAAELYPKSVEPLLISGCLYSGHQDAANALTQYSRVLALQPDHAVCLYNRAIANNSEGKFKAALVDINRAIRLDDKDADYYSVRAQTLQKLGRPKDAKLDHDTAVSMDETSVQLLGNRAAYFYAEKDDESALADYFAVLKIDANHMQASMHAAYILYKFGRYEEAAKIYDMLAESDSATDRCFVAMFYATCPVEKYRSCKLARAILAAAFTEYCGSMPKEFFQIRAMVEANAGNWEQAVADQNAVIAMLEAEPKPDDKELAIDRARLKQYQAKKPERGLR